MTAVFNLSTARDINVAGFSKPRRLYTSKILKMLDSDSLPTPPSEEQSSSYSRPSPSQAAADAIPILVDDTYHIFHLTTPPNTIHHPPRLRSCWSRMRSTDLINWVRNPTPVVLPGRDSADPDTSGAWTGSAVLGPDGNMNIFYTGYSLPQGGKQVILRVVSENRHGRSFRQDKRQPITIKADTSVTAFEDIDFRDPYIFFNESADQFWMLVATRLRTGPYWTRGCIALLTSPNLDEWEMQPEPLYAPGDMFCPECPELFSLPNGKWYLVYSRFTAPNAGTVYRVADLPYGPFRVPRDGSQGRIDGRRWYAAKSCPKAGDPSKRVYFGWIADKWEEDGKWLWGGDMGVPREVSADANGCLRVEPAPEALAAFRHTATQSVASPSLRLTSIGSTSAVFPEQLMYSQLNGDTVLSVVPQSYDAAAFGLVFDVDNDMKAHRLRLSRVGETWTVVLLTDSIPLDDFWADQYDLHITRLVDGPEIVRHEGVAVDGPLRVILRGKLIECFIGGRSISFRLPGTDVANQIGTSMVETQLAKATKRFGFFVEDGAVELDVSVRMDGALSKCTEAIL